MRIIAGSAKGVRLAPVPAGTRPVSDRAREGLFSSLGPEVPGARVLDLYAGTGALGIEALSRGAEAAVFVDKGRRAARAVLENLRRTGLEDQGRVVVSDVSRFLREPPGPVDIAFLDPPYDTPQEEVGEILDLLVERGLREGSAMVLTRPARSYTPVVPVNWRVARRLEYGDSLVILYREV